MPALGRRGSIALAVVGVALLGARPAAAQGGPPHGHEGLFGRLGYGAWVERMDQAKAERRLQRVEARLPHDSARGDTAAVEHDLRQIHRDRYRIGVDEWLIRYNLCQELGPYPNPLRMDPPTCAAIAQYHQPPLGP